MVWHGEGWAPPCVIALVTPHDDKDKQTNRREKRGSKRKKSKLERNGKWVSE